MRKCAFLFMTLPAFGLAACTGGANHLGNPLMLPINALTTATSNAAYNRTRGQVEVFVKTNHPALIRDITAGGGRDADPSV